MSLFKQLLIAICVFLVVAFSGSFIVSLEARVRSTSTSCVPTPRMRPPHWHCR